MSTEMGFEKLEINADSFFHACKQSWLARRRKDGRFDSHTRYEPFLFGTYEIPVEASLQSFLKDIESVFAHHAEIHPQLRKGDKITLESQSFFTNAFSTLLADFEALLMAWTGLPVPIPTEQLPRRKGAVYGALENTIAKFFEHVDSEPAKDENGKLIPFQPFATSAEEQGFQADVWELLHSLARKYLKGFAELFISFVLFLKAPTPERVAIDWRVRPPSCDAYLRQFRLGPYAERPRRGKPGADDRRPPRGAPSGPATDEDPSAPKAPRFPKRPMDPDVAAATDPGLKMARQEEAQASGREKREGIEGGEKREFREKREGFEGREKREFREKREGFEGREGGFRRGGPQGKGRFEDSNRRRGAASTGPRTDAQDAETSPELDEALHEAREVLEALKKNPHLDSLGLEPRNSWVRHKQHALITDAGFISESRGEGRNRSVFVRRPQ